MLEMANFKLDDEKKCFSKLQITKKFGKDRW